MPIPFENTEKAPGISNPTADAFEANAEDKKKLDYSQEVPFYPDGTVELTDRNSESNKKIVADLLKKMTTQNKRPARHGDKAGMEIDNYGYYLLIDENANPVEKLFKAKEPTGKAGSEQGGEIPKEIVKEKTKGYPEIKIAPPDVLQRALKTFKDQRGRDMDNEETSTAFDTKDYEYVVLCDKSKKNNPYRVFKSPNPVPA